MKSGAGNKNQVIVAVVLAAIAIPLFLHMLANMGGTTPAAAARPAGQARLVRQVRRGPAANTAAIFQPSIDPTLRTDLLRESENVEYKGTGRNIFTAQLEAPTPIPQPVDTCAFRDKSKCPKPAPAVPVVQGPPPIPLKFYGFANEAGGPRQIFLSEGDDVFVAKEGDIVNRRYRVVRITPTQVVIQDLLSNNQQSIPLSG